MQPEALKETLKAHSLWLQHTPAGIRADLTGADLTGANLTGAYLTGADLTGAYLTGANLNKAYLTGANLTEAYLNEAYLTGANLTGANLTGANLTGANLTGANLTGADLGVSTVTARKLRLLGACMEASLWVEAREKEGASAASLLSLQGEHQLHEWLTWLRDVLGGPVTVERFEHVFAYATRGCIGI